MSSSPQRRPSEVSRRSDLREFLAITQAVKTEFRVERLIAIIAVSVALVIMLGAAGAAAVQKDWQASKAMLFGSGGVCTSGLAALFYMYNRSLLFMERMAGSERKDRSQDE